MIVAVILFILLEISSFKYIALLELLKSVALRLRRKVIKVSLITGSFIITALLSTSVDNLNVMSILKYSFFVPEGYKPMVIGSISK